MFEHSMLAGAVLAGCGATLLMDAWLALLRRAGVPTLNFAMIGRWVGHLARGTVAHRSIVNAPAVPGELLLGWLTHYAIGIAFAVLLLAVAGPAWLDHPSPGPALALGLATVVAPLFIMQPAMGLGVMASKTPRPLASCLRSVANHAVFGLGLWLSALLLEAISR